MRPPSTLTSTIAGALLTFSVAAPAEIAGGVALSGHVRERATYMSAIDFDSNDEDTGWSWAQRIHATADVDLKDGMQARISLMSGLQSGIETTPIEDNHLALQEGFLILPVAGSAASIGRQEIRLGSQRLVGWRDGTNVRRTWDGLRLNGGNRNWTWDVIGLQPVDVEPEGAFNDTSDDDRQLAGVYTTRSAGRSDLDLYYLYAHYAERNTVEGPGVQDRHTVGLRLFGERGSIFWDWEAVYQFGEHGGLDIEAWTLATNTGYRLPGAWQPSLMLSTNVASGDSDRSDNKLETFDALYPRGNYFSELAQLGPANFFNLNPYLTLAPNDDLFISLDINFYWRLEKEDGVYGPAGNLIRPPLGSRERFVNTAISLAVEWQASKHWFLGLALAHSRPEDFFEDTGSADNASFAQFTIEARI